MSENHPAKRVKSSTSSDVVPNNTSEISVFDLPEEILHKILGGTTIRIERWTDLSLVCRAWQATMQSLVIPFFLLARPVRFMARY